MPSTSMFATPNGVALALLLDYTEPPFPLVRVEPAATYFRARPEPAPEDLEWVSEGDFDEEEPHSKMLIVRKIPYANFPIQVVSVQI